MDCTKNTVLSLCTYYTNIKFWYFLHQYVYHRNKLPVVFSAYFDKNKTIHDHDTRQKQDFHTYSVHSEFGKRAIKYKGSNIWNDLPDDLKGIQSPCSFTGKLKEYFLQLS